MDGAGKVNEGLESYPWDPQSNGRSHGTVTGNRVKWSAFHFRKFTLATEVEDQRVGRDNSRKINVEAVTQIQERIVRSII